MHREISESHNLPWIEHILECAHQSATAGGYCGSLLGIEEAGDLLL